MIAYDKTKLFNAKLLKKAKQWFTRQLLSVEQYAAITERYKVDFYTPNVFIKIGLFLFTWISILAAAGFVSIFFFQVGDNDVVVSFLCLLFSAGCIGLLEMLIKQKKLYRSGIDEALLYAAILFVSGTIGSLFSGWFSNTNSTVLLFTLLLMPVLAAATVRYADTLVAFALALCCYVVFFLFILKLGSIAKMIMPFAMMLLSVALYMAAKRLEQQPRLQYWQTVIVVFECVGLLLFYFAGNYYVIREASVKYFDLHIAPGEDIPLTIFFYLFTAVVPLLYVFYGLKRKDRLLLWAGLATVALSALTFKYYFSTGHPEVVLVVAGMLLIGIAYIAIRYLKTPKHGITFEEEPDEDNFLKTNGEALLQARSFGHTTHAAPRTVEFGGGSSGGGGATGDW